MGCQGAIILRLEFTEVVGFSVVQRLRDSPSDFVGCINYTSYLECVVWLSPFEGSKSLT